MRLPGIILIGLFGLLFNYYCLANSVDEAADKRIRAVLGADKSVKITPYQDQLLQINAGAQTLFATIDGRYIFGGPILDTSSKQNIVALAEQGYRKQRLAGLNEDMFLSFPASKPEKHTVTLFTDIDCTYCRKFHSIIDQFLIQGITVNYIMLPRAGENSPSFDKAASVFCSSKPNENMTLAMKDQFFENNHCDHTISKQLQLAMEFAINKTPTMILPDGKIVEGYLTPERLLHVLANAEKNNP